MSNSSSDSSLVDSSLAGPDQRPLILALGIVFGSLAIAFTAARFHARKVKAVKFQSDDWTCLAALVGCHLSMPIKLNEGRFSASVSALIPC